VTVESRDNVCIRREKKKKLLVVFASLFCLSRSRRSPDRLLKKASVVSLASLVKLILLFQIWAVIGSSHFVKTREQ